MEREVEVTPGVTLWVQDLPAAGEPTGEPVLLVADANEPGPAWPDELVERLRAHRQVIRYDHRDTGRSTPAFEEGPYALADLADDAQAVLDACDVDRAHAVGIGMGGTLVQLLLVDAPDRLVSAVLLCTAALDADRAGLPGPARDVARMWQEMADPRDEPGDLAWRVEYRRRLNGSAMPFDDREFRVREQELIVHAGRSDVPTAHLQADPADPDRGPELASVTVPTLVVEAPQDPVYPPPHASYLAGRIGSARLVRIPGMGHALGSAALSPLAEILLEHLSSIPTAP